jgi:23S rRNA pseudouridine1911/1915/1917 synthase
VRIPITDADAGARLDKLLVQKVPGLGRAGAKRLFAEGRVRLLAIDPPPSPAPEAPTTGPKMGSGPPHPHGRRAVKGDLANPGDAIELDLDETAQGSAAVPDPEAPLEVVLETPQVVVLDKPAGQPTAPLDPGERGTLANALLARYPEVAGIGFSPREPGLCHRLDTGTSGLVLAARTQEAFETLTGALKDGRLDKRYLVICAAADLPESGTIEIPLAPHPKDRRRVYACVHPRDVARLAPRPASTSYQKLREHGPWALVEVKAPKAARHQIRAHFAAIDHPLAGDALYGGPPLPVAEGSTPPEGAAEGTRHALHAHRIVWKGDATVPAFEVLSPLPSDLAALVEE